MTTPTATVVIGCYNHRDYVVSALDSFAQQTMKECSLIVTDDQSSDGSREVIESWLGDHDVPATFIANNRNMGICATFNAALARVDTEFVGFMSADDWMHPERLSKQSKALHAAGDTAGLLYGDVIRVDPEGSEENFSRSYPSHWGFGSAGDDLFPRLLAHNFIPAPSVLMRTSAARAVGGYDEKLVFEDHDMWLRLSQRFSVAYLPEPLVYWRVTSGSLSATFKTTRQREFHMSNLDLLEKHLQHPDPDVARLAWQLMCDNAWMAYRLGAQSARVRQIMRKAARNSGVKKRLVAAAATLHIPGPGLYRSRRFIGDR